MSFPPLSGLPQGKARVILLDPAWGFRTRGKKGMALPQRARRAHYKPMLLKDMKALDVAALAHPDGCQIAMWTFGAFFRQAMELGESWGARYNTDLFHWLKLSKHGKRRISLGYYSRKQVESVFLFTIGKPQKAKDRGIRQLIEEPIREHSRKPDCVYDYLERMFDGPYIELFARTQRIGWDSWGDDKFRFGFSGGAAGKGRLRV